MVSSHARYPRANTHTRADPSPSPRRQVPQAIHMLKAPAKGVTARGLVRRSGKGWTTSEAENTQMESEEMLHAFQVASFDVAYRYAEYCITAPLLFIAVTALLTVDAPAWLYFTGYWLIQACNAIGLAYHATLCADLFRDYEKRITAQGVPIETTSVVEWMRALLVNGSWYATCSLLLTKQTH